VKIEIKRREEKRKRWR